MQSYIDVKWDNRTPVIIGKITPDRANRTPTRNGGASIIYYLFSIMSGYLPNEKITSQGVFLQFICYQLTIRSVDEQRNS